MCLCSEFLEVALRRLQNILLLDPGTGDVIPGLSGARKIRFAYRGKGTRSGIRVIYVDIVVEEQIYLLLAYPKSRQSNFTEEQKKILLEIIRELKEKP
jgi:hypothetical protein